VDKKKKTYAAFEDVLEDAHPLGGLGMRGGAEEVRALGCLDLEGMRVLGVLCIRQRDAAETRQGDATEEVAAGKVLGRLVVVQSAISQDKVALLPRLDLFALLHQIAVVHARHSSGRVDFALHLADVALQDLLFRCA